MRHWRPSAKAKAHRLGERSFLDLRAGRPFSCVAAERAVLWVAVERTFSCVDTPRTLSCVAVIRPTERFVNIEFS